MKRMVFLLAACSTTLSSSAQLFSGESLNGAAVGGLIGGIIGHNSGRRTAEEAGIGAGVGLVLGALAGESRRREDYYSRTYFSTVPTGYVVAETRPNYAVTGTVLGGLTGGIVGHNSGRRTAEGIAIGAVGGLVIGAVAEQAARREEAQALAPGPYLAGPTVVTSQAPPDSAPAETSAAPIRTAFQGFTPTSGNMNSANALFGR